jgi:hypothetical protein
VNEEVAMTGSESRSADHVLLQWQARVRVLGNRSLWGALLVGFGIPSVLMGVVFGIIGRPVDGAILGAGCLLLFLVIFLGVGAVIDLAGGLRAVFMLTDAGVWSFAGKGARHAGDAAVLAGAVAGSLSAVGAGLAAGQESKVFIPWSEVRKVTPTKGGPHILIKGSFGSKPIRLYCNEGNYEDAIRILRERCPGKMGGE